MKKRRQSLRFGVLPLLLCLATCLFCPPVQAQEKVAGKGVAKKDVMDDATKKAHKVLEKVRVIAYDLPGDPAGKGGGRLVLVRLDRKDQMIVTRGQTFTPEAGMVFTVDKINMDGTAYVSGSGISMGRIKKATRREREAWSIKLREGRFDK